jgi:hypothetical protein
MQKDPEDRGSTFLVNVLKHLPDYTASHPRITVLFDTCIILKQVNTPPLGLNRLYLVE